MPKNRSTPANVAASAEARNEDFAVNHSACDFTTSGGKVLKIFVLLHPGAENGIKLPELATLTNLDEREVRRQIQAERKAGKLILSDCLHGYFLPENSSDVQRFARSMSRRAAEIASIARAAEAALADMAGQQHMEGW